MILGRIRRGEQLVLIALVLLLVALSVRWFDVLVPSAGSGDDVRVGAGSGWSTLGHPWIELLVLVALSWGAVLVQAVRSGAGRPSYGAMVTIVLAVPLTALVLFLTLLRALVFRPDGLDLMASVTFIVGTEDDVFGNTALAAGGWLGLVALLVGLAGAWLAMADDRTRAAESTAQPAVAVSPVPELRSEPPATV
ncbi:hypothetical protein [Patulibacter sp.]|uniref:hypothetical protein n=1 Tax=Patulibacter sp. TaxID=1912859 RepID=UPI00271D8881|nr:hypothetical protein [Patulibacter sp.]MDO9409971.1 hypothetical protein [Patulibacter sp.]